MASHDEVARREERERLQREQHAADLKAVLELPQGRRFVSRLLFEHGALQEQGYSPDSRQHAFHDGQRAVGIALDREVRLAAPQLWALMHQERITAIATRLDQEAGLKSDH